MEANPIYEGAMYETTPGESLKLLLNNTSKVDTEHVPHFSKAPSDPIAEEEVRYSGIQVAVETKPTAAIGNTFTYKRSHGDHDMTKNADDSSSMANVQAPYDGFEEEMTVCNFKIV